MNGRYFNMNLMVDIVNPMNRDPIDRDLSDFTSSRMSSLSIINAFMSFDMPNIPNPLSMSSGGGARLEKS
jgi:hypothetical protein